MRACADLTISCYSEQSSEITRARVSSLLLWPRTSVFQSIRPSPSHKPTSKRKSHLIYLMPQISYTTLARNDTIYSFQGHAVSAAAPKTVEQDPCYHNGCPFVVSLIPFQNSLHCKSPELTFQVGLLSWTPEAAQLTGLPLSAPACLLSN